MSIQLESREMFISPREICKKNPTKEIPGLKYLMKLFQNKKSESQLNDFQSIYHSFVPSPISEGGGLNFRKMGKGENNWRIIFSSLAVIVTDTTFPF